MISRTWCRLRWPLWAALAIVLGGCAGMVERPRPTTQSEFHVPPEHVPQRDGRLLYMPGPEPK